MRERLFARAAESHHPKPITAGDPHLDPYSCSAHNLRRATIVFPLEREKEPGNEIQAVPEYAVSEMTDDERAIRALVDTWMTATKAGDVTTVLSLMTDDVVFMVPGQKPFGKEAFAAASANMKGVHFDGRSEIQEIQVLSDWAYLRNYIEITTSRDGTPPVHRSSYTLTILRKQDGQWLLARDANLVA
jgi:uncharacterized protein (TIGR02246 family)